jgi:small conductance mechanosensitive channel
LGHAVDKALDVAGATSELLHRFLVRAARRATIIVGIIVGLTALEVNVGPLLAVIGAMGFVVGFALQSTLSNFASGLMIMLYRPFDIGDAVDVAGINGKVESMSLVNTKILTWDNQVMVVPNNSIWSDIITNVTGSETRRVDMVFGIGYDDDIKLAKEILEDIASDHPLTLDDPSPTVQLNELGDSSLNFICRPWAKTSDYWGVYWDVTRTVKERFDAAGISIPFPQRDIHVYQAGQGDPVALSSPSGADPDAGSRGSRPPEGMAKYEPRDDSEKNE